ncbi:arginine-tRNA ligase [Batrachochytrium salamandrivorans]|nr:arginine-tRNA ligase [Batrachochytrium salamandrivorans]
MFLALGTLGPKEACETLRVAKLSVLGDQIEINETFGGFSVLGRYPVLQLSEHVCVFGIQAVQDYLGSTGRAKETVGEIQDGRSANIILSVAIRDAIIRAFPKLNKIQISPEVKFNEGKRANGDYTFSNCAQLSQHFKPTSPQELAQTIAANLDLQGELAWIVQRVEVVGFYINFFLASEFLVGKINIYSGNGNHLPAAPLLKKKRIVIDFSSPNIAKEMHVGHLRSTIIGDSVSRFLMFAGHDVLKVNHVGDWGTQFGMLLHFLFTTVSPEETVLLNKIDQMTLSELTQLYRSSKEAFDASEEFKVQAKLKVVELQQSKIGDKVRNVWAKLVEVSKRGFDSIYKRLKVTFDNPNQPENTPGLGYCGESFYQNQIDSAIASVNKLTTKRGEAVLFFTGLAEAKQPASETNPDGEIPLFLRKSDGGFGYDSTDLAACKFRIEKLKADQIIYVTDGGQSLHFNMVFQAAQMANWGQCQLDHCKFGVVTVKGGGKFKTRDGPTVTLSGLMDDAQARMREILLQRQEDNQFTSEELDELSQAIGMAAIKYFDLRNNRIKDYGFDAELMCSPIGDTGVYLMYCYARVCSILDKGQVSNAEELKYDWSEQVSIRERNVALALSRFNEVVAGALEYLTPHPLCGYLYVLASEFSTFVTDENERVWAKRDKDDVGAPIVLESNRGKQRYVLCKAMKSVLFEGLGLLGITPFNRM